MSNALPARVSIFRPTTFGPTCEGVPMIEIEVTDESSSTRVLRLRVSAEDFALAVTGRGDVTGLAEWQVERIGLVREHKVVVCCDVFDMRRHEVDGWSGNEKDLRNSHNRTEGGHCVRFVRWVSK